MNRYTKDKLPTDPSFFAEFNKRVPTRAVQMNEPFECLTIDDNIASGKPGDFLCLDSEGFPYPCAQTVFQATMTPVEPW